MGNFQDDLAKACQRYCKKSAMEAANEMIWWGNLLDRARGNVDAILSVFRSAGICDNDIAKAFEEAKAL